MASISLWTINVCSLQITFSWLLAFCKNWKCVFQFSSVYYQFLYPIIWQMIPWSILHHLYLIQICLGLSWNLKSLIGIYLGLLSSVLNQFNAVSNSCQNISKSSVKLYYPHIFVLSSAKFTSLSSLIKKKPFIKRLKRIGPRIDSWGTPDKKIWKKLSVLFCLTLCVFCVLGRLRPF